MRRKLDCLVSSEEAHLRLDVFLRRKVPEIARSQIQRWIIEKRATVNGRAAKPSYRVNPGDRIICDIPAPEPAPIVPEALPIPIIYKDAYIVVVDKPSGLVVHPGPGQKQATLVHALLHFFPEIRSVGDAERPGLVHRLDKDTSGLMVVARSPEAHRSLGQQFRKRQVEKTYTALVWGRINKAEDRIGWPLGRHVKHGERISIKTKKPRAAETTFRVLKRFKDCTLLDVTPITGRTHQIRVHLAAYGHPIVGDTRYGRKKTPEDVPRLFLHACRLAFRHPASGEKVEFVSSLPEELENWLERIERSSG